MESFAHAAVMKQKLWFSQLFALIVKEVRQIWRDPSSWLVAIILPLIFLLLFGYGITLDAGILPVAILDESGGEQALSLASDFANSPWFRTRPAGNMAEAGQMMSNSSAQGVIVIRENFDRKLAANENGDIQIIVDGSEPNNAQYIRRYSEGMIVNWQNSLYPGGEAPNSPIGLEPRIWFNPAARSEMFLVPGSITVIMALIGTLLTSLVFAREWERGTMEALVATPASPLQILLGKLAPYFCMGMGSMLLCVGFSIYMFEIPFRGSLWALLLVSAIFMLCALGQGLLISVSFKTQLVAAEAGLFTGFLPALMLSGFVFDIDSMAWPLQTLSRVLPATWFNICIRTLFLAGDIWPLFYPCLLYMTILGAILLTIVYIKIPRQLPKT